MVHGDCTSHTGGSYTMGKITFFSIFWKQKLNSKRSTETELITVHESIGHLIRITHFLFTQGHKTVDAVLKSSCRIQIVPFF